MFAVVTAVGVPLCCCPVRWLQAAASLQEDLAKLSLSSSQSLAAAADALPSAIPSTPLHGVSSHASPARVAVHASRGSLSPGAGNSQAPFEPPTVPFSPSTHGARIPLLNVSATTSLDSFVGGVSGSATPRHGAVTPGVVYSVVQWCTVVYSGVQRCTVVCSGVVYSGVQWCGVQWCRVVSCPVLWYDMV